jgi:hypothetical protein
MKTKRYMYITKIVSGVVSRKNFQFALDHFHTQGRRSYLHRAGRPALSVTTPDGAVARCRVLKSYTV